MKFKKLYTLTGALLGFGAPVGALLLRWMTGSSASTEFDIHSFFYLYMGISTVLVFSGFGFLLGHHADTIDRQKRAFHELSIRDSLTGAYNRRYFFEFLDREFTRTSRYNLELSLAVLDLDNFKSYNDRYGHVCGDEILRKTASLIQSRVREADLFARTGGEEFALLLPETDLSSALTFMELIRQVIEKMDVRCNDASVMATVTIGVSSFQTSRPISPTQIFSRADSAMYQGKHAGKNCVSAFEREPR